MAIALKVSICLGHAALAQLYNLVASTNTDFQKESVKRASEIATIVDTFSEEDFVFLDPVLSVSK
jgi:hypothetical protein